MSALTRLSPARRDQLGAVLLRGGALVIVAGSAIATARLLGPSEYGGFTTATAFTAIASAGIAAGHVERAMRAGAAPDLVSREAMAASAAAVLRQVLRYAPLWILLLLPIGLASQVSVATVILLAVPISVFLAIGVTLEGFTRGHFRQLRDLLPVNLLAPLALLGGAAVALLIGADVGAVGFLSWRLVVVIAVSGYFLHRLGIHRRTVWRRADSIGLDRLGWFAAARVLFVIQLQSSILIAGFLGAEAAGLYSAAFRSAEPVQAGTTAAVLLVGPITAAAVQSGRLRGAEHEIKQHARLGALLAVIPALIVFAFPELILSLFGAEYRSVAPTLRILILAPLVTTLFGPSMVFASMARLQRDLVVAMSLAVALQFGAAAVLYSADELTLDRIAWLDVAGTVLWNSVVWWRCRRRLGMTAAIL